MTRPKIPEFEPEVIKAIADKHHHGDPEKVATTKLDSFAVHGVLLTSRHDKADEYRTMVHMVDGLDPDLREFINNIYCDSKANDCYTVCLEP